MSGVPQNPGPVTTTTNSDQWLRRVSLIVSDTSGSGLDLSNLRIKFNIQQADLTAARPNWAEITIYNLADKTVANIINEYTLVTLQAGYQPPGKFGIIFQGTIKQFKRGHESVEDSFLTLFAADSDLSHNFALTNTTLAPGWTSNDEINQHIKALGQFGTTQGYNGNGVAGGSGGLLPQNTRGKLVLGVTGAGLDRVGRTAGFTWVIVNGKVQIVPLEGYLPGEAVVLNARTGLIGWPEQTTRGINATCLLNPAIKLQGLIQINNAQINQTIINQNLSVQQEQQVGPANTGPGYTDLQFYASIQADGFYRVMVIEYQGDTRGGVSSPWYCHLTCLAADLSAASGQQVPNSAPTPPAASI